MDLMTTIRAFIRDELIGDPKIALEAETPILEQGYLTSLQTVELVAFLEECFQARIDPEDVTEENFRDLASIAALVARKRGAS
jgi:methoxymalonate biosynthesis acyl carrier protein